MPFNITNFRTVQILQYMSFFYKLQNRVAAVAAVAVVGYKP